MRFIILSLFLLIKGVKTHSWLECTDYQINSEEDTYYHDDDKCLGYPLGFQIQHAAGFGVDTGFNVNGGDPARHVNGGCTTGLNDSYNDFTTRATYVAGQEVCVAYPAKNHVAETCTNEFIPDAGVIISRGQIIDSNTFNNDQTYEHLNGVHVNGQIDYKGYQNCPKFCENMDKSLCTMCFKLEDDIPSGVYTFKWNWEFNPDEFYYSCWNAEVIGNQDDNPPSSPSPSPVPTPPCTPTVVPSPVPTELPTPSPTEHEEECPGFPGKFVTSLIHCPPPTPPPTPAPTTTVPTPAPTTTVPTPAPTTPTPDCPDLPIPTEPPTLAPTPGPDCPSLPQPDNENEEVIHPIPFERGIPQNNP